jgi:hypothetical protein
VSAIDTPDYQRGIVLPQQLLSTQTGGDATVTVTVPANAQTLVVVGASGFGTPTVTATGHVTGIPYPGTQLAQGTNTGTNAAWFFDIAPSIDPTVDVHVAGSGANDWWVYSDNAHHVVTSFGPV